MKNDNIHRHFFFFAVFVANFEFAGFALKQNTRVAPFPWKRSALQTPDRERTNQSTGICLRLCLPYNNQRYYTTKRLIGDLLSNTPNCYVWANFADIYLRGMRDRSMRSGTELAREIQLTDWSTAGEQGKLVFVVSTTPSLAQFISLFTTGKNRLSIVQITHEFKFFTLRFLSRKNAEKKFALTHQFFFRNFNPIRRLRVARKPV